MLLSDLSRGWYVTTKSRLLKAYPFQLKLTFRDILSSNTMISYNLMLYKDFIISSQPTKVKSPAKDYRSFGVVWMSRQVMKILMAINRFYIQI